MGKPNTGYPSKVSQGLIKQLEDRGWTGRRTSSGHWYGREPKGKQTLSIPGNLSETTSAYRNAKANVDYWLRNHPVEEPTPLTPLTLPLPPALRIVPDLEEEPQPVLERRLISEHSYLYKDSETKDTVKYTPAEGCIQQQWEEPDGTMTVTYVCAQPGCGYTHPTNPRSVSNHYGQQHTRKTRPRELITTPKPEQKINPHSTAVSSKENAAQRKLGRIYALLDAVPATDLRAVEAERDRLLTQVTDQTDLNAVLLENKLLKQENAKLRNDMAAFKALVNETIPS